MTKLRPRRVHLPILALAALLWTPGFCAAADPSKSTISSSTTRPRPARARDAEGIGRYRRQGTYRSQGRYYGSEQAAKPWNPPYYHLNKYYQVKPLEEYAARPFVGNLSRSQLQPYQLPCEPSEGCARSGLLVPLNPVVYLPSEPRYEEPSPPAPAPVAQQPPQIYIIQPPAPPPVREEPVIPPPAAPEPPPRPVELQLNIRPATAEVSLDDRYLGTGDELNARAELLVLPPGVHILEVHHPDYPPQRLIFGVSSEGPIRAVIDLAADRPGRRARIETREDYGFDL